MDPGKRIIIVQFSSNLDGSAFSALMLADGLKERGWQTYVVFGFQGPMLQKFRDSGHQVVVLPHKSWLREKKGIRFLRNLKQERKNAGSFVKYFSQVNPAVVYVNTAVSYAGALAAHQSGIPVVWHMRELFSNVGGEMRCPSIFKSRVQRMFSGLSDRIVANSISVARNMLGMDSTDAIVVPNAVNENLFIESRPVVQTRVMFGLPEDRPILGVPGTLRPMKGHPFFFEAFSLLLEKNNEIVAAIPGGGNKLYTEQLHAQVRALGIEENVKFLGYIEDMPAFYRSNDVACIPSVAEPFGRTVIEAFASGIPVVATAVGGIKETITDKVNGMLVEYGDVQSLARVLLELFEHEGMRSEIAKQARKDAEEKYRASVYKARLCDIVAQLSSESAK